MDEFGRMFDPSWAALEAHLAAVLRSALASGYWTRHATALTMSPQSPANMQACSPRPLRWDSWVVRRSSAHVLRSSPWKLTTPLLQLLLVGNG